MAWFADVEKMELQPESDDQPAIRPTQLIFHSVAAAWTPRRVYEYWRDSTNYESHFAVGYDGSCAQFIGTETRADANMYANRRSDGTGAVSVETASDDEATDPWTPEQVATLIRIGVWMHQHHGIPLRICRSWDDPGYGVHRMFPQWSDGGTDCPGSKRAQQFRDVVFPGIVARANGKTAPTPDQIGDDEMPNTLGEFNGSERKLPRDQWTTVDVNGVDLVKNAGAYSATVYLTVDAPAGATVQGRWYHQRRDGSRWDGPIVERITTSGSSFVDFTHAGSIVDGEAARFEVTYGSAPGNDARPAVITAARVRGVYWKAGK
ncbi:N-acetylmuramoyl-L-alanine amidase [Streptomyces sp. AV19]|uniref:peptidoglycan recognition protein family protein n=1 Tax=Streptomyces sp. AV19 TaxID=2793068 RepID=UPI0018FE7E26|nr:N-acetylmuramoyl-L-alanine amidase [Streptomyces sp. AV19]MBH1936493.1 N-acetylmuramoyl-L-alanine amidase [Streptomyces sp. AV19]MDG4532550.1 N-acetylmuramoyl-L-alanine amidase [Streptomyces sp. AV19]